MAITTKNALQVLLLVALLPLAALSSRAGPSAHKSHGQHGHGHGPKHAHASPPPSLPPAPAAAAAQDYDSASVHVGAAAEYPQVCKALFRRQRPGQYPPELAGREEALGQLCSVALDIIALLANSSS
ncbi:pectinesterase inhibitor 28-like [Panicum virgatum]|uniref:Uncharacterized protein n=1 Tax=Panicum virgatum TaxID=38727 RepID=A0A8T0R723_PANVG|nr:pectinesterase inhibitor 28-like [Panicum virgatum]KAG2581020.1 hypothetical protein PVAP13_6KG362600 [Panicum virgatum]